MSDKKTIVHIIYNLARGGAETMLVNVLPQLKEYRNVIITLSPENHFEGELECDELVCVNTPSLWSLPAAVKKCRKLVKQFAPALVHSHLPYSNFVARLSTPSSIPLISTIHTPVSAAVDYKKWYIRLLDRFTYHYRKSAIIAVSQLVLKDYAALLQTSPRQASVIYTFAPPSPGTGQLARQPGGTTALVTVGSLRSVKNFDYLIRAFALLKNKAVVLHIYGRGAEQAALSQLIKDTGANVVLKGQVSNIPALLQQYDVFVMASKFEGFSVSVLEAMTAKLPMLLSDIPSFREQCSDSAVYFDTSDPGDFAAKLEQLLADKNQLQALGNMGYNRMIHNFTLSHHIQQLELVYESAINSITGSR